MTLSGVHLLCPCYEQVEDGSYARRFTREVNIKAVAVLHGRLPENRRIVGGVDDMVTEGLGLS